MPLGKPVLSKTFPVNIILPIVSDKYNIISNSELTSKGIFEKNLKPFTLISIKFVLILPNNGLKIVIGQLD